MATQANVLRVAENAATGAQRIGAEVRGAADAYTSAVRSTVPTPGAVTFLPSAAVGAMTEIRSAWMEWIGQTTQAGTQMSQELLRQTAEQQRRFAVAAMQVWMEHNARVMRITMRMAQGYAFGEHRGAGQTDIERWG
jgi:hypothetical protein